MSVEKIAKLIKKGDIQKVAQLLQSPAFDINQLESKSGKTLLQLAIESQQSQIFHMLLKIKGIKLDQVSKTGETALQTAILMNSPQYVEQLLRAKINPKAKNQAGNSVMYTAIKNKTNPEIIKKLVHHNFDVNESVPKYGSLLNLAIACDQFDNFITLLENPNIDLTILDDEENNCLLLSTKLKKGEFVQAILKKLKSIDKSKMSDMEKQFYINSSDMNGDTALHVAAKKDYQTITDLILREGNELGLDQEIKNKNGKTFKDILNQRAQARQKQKQNQQYQQKKRTQQKRIKMKQKQEQKIRATKQDEIQRAAEKKRKKQEQMVQSQKKDMRIQMQKNRKIWIAGIAIIMIIGIMYLVFLSAVPNKKHTQTF